jgi:uncharacterized repeat protein (TIGR03803 family)
MKSRALCFFSIGTIILASLGTGFGSSFRILHTFSGSDGSEPTYLLQRTDGVFGVTFLGGPGALGDGVLYQIDSSGTFSVLHEFADLPDGSLPGRLIQARDGTIYGVTLSGGARGGGTIYKVDLGGSYSVIHSFNPSTEGSAPNFLVQVNDDLFYGTTATGGVPAEGCPNREPQGTLFRMDGAGKVTALHTFCEEFDGSGPNCVIKANDGSLYGTCNADGPLGQGLGNGTFWKSDRAGNVTLLHVFGPKTLNGDEPTQPRGIVQASDGLFYGVANSGGLSSQGAIFRADPSGNVKTIHSFNDFATDGADPESNFMLGPDGFFYGTASDGGLPVADFSNSGVVYRADTTGRVWVLHSFHGDDGSNPNATPALGRGQTVFASAIFGGPTQDGTTISFKAKPNVPIADLSYSPNPVHGGEATTATLTLSQPAAGSGQVVKLFSSGPLSEPPSVTVPAGQTSISFMINTQPVSIGFDATVTAYIDDVGMSAPLTLLP